MSLLLALTGSSSATYTLSVEPASYDVSNNSVDLLFNRVLQVDQGSYLVTPENVDLVYTASGATYTLSVDPYSYDIATFNVDLLIEGQTTNGAAYDPRPRYKKIYEDDEPELKESISDGIAEKIAVEEAAEEVDLESEIAKRFIEKVQKASLRDELIAKENTLELLRIQEEEEYMAAICIALLV